MKGTLLSSYFMEMLGHLGDAGLIPSKKPNSNPQGLNHYRNEGILPVQTSIFPSHLSSAKVSTAPASVEVLIIYEWSKVLRYVVSHTINFPNFQGTIVMPSWRLPPDP